MFAVVDVVVDAEPFDPPEVVWLEVEVVVFPDPVDEALVDVDAVDEEDPVEDPVAAVVFPSSARRSRGRAWSCPWRRSCLSKSRLTILSSGCRSTPSYSLTWTCSTIPWSGLSCRSTPSCSPSRCSTIL